MKTCPACRAEKPLEEFNWKNQARGLRHSHCRACRRLHVRSHYASKPAYYVEKARRRRQDYRENTYKLLFEYLASHSCVDCGETDPIVLEFDHVDRNEKTAAVSEMIRDQRPWRVILDEIAKCQVRCANCHRRRTARQQGWFSYLPVA